MMMSLSSGPKRSSRHAVLPPYLTVVGPGVGMESPHAPEGHANSHFPSLLARDLEEDLGFLDFPVHLALHIIEIVMGDGKLFQDSGREALGVAVSREADLIGVGEDSWPPPR